MKKLLALLLIAVLCISALTLAACFPGSTPDEDDDKNDQTTVEYDLEGAKDYLESYFDDESTVTPSDYDLPAKLPVGNYTYEVTWTTDVEGITITVGTNGMAHVDLNEKTPVEVTYTLTATIKAGDGTTTTYTRTCTIPKYEVLTHEQFLAAEKGVTATIEGTIVMINSTDKGNKYQRITLVDADGQSGYYCHNLNKDPIKDLGLKIGMKVTVTGTTDDYNGMRQLTKCDVKVVESTPATITPVDITNAFKNNESLAKYVGNAIVINGVTIGSQELGGTSEYLFFELNGRKGYVRTYVTDLPHDMSHAATDNADKAKIDSEHAAKFGWTANVTGVLVRYNDNYYIVPQTTTPFTYLELVEKTPAQKFAAEIEAIDLPSAITADTVLQLPLTATYYNDVTLSWALDNTAFTIGEDGKVDIKLSADATTIKFTLTLTIGTGDAAVTETKEYTVQVAANLVLSETRPYVPYVNQVKANKVLYLDGGVSGRYLTTTTDASKAVDVYAEKVTGGYKFYILVENVKQYITIYKNDENKDSVKYDPNGTCVFSYNPVINAWVTIFDNLEYYVGTYNTFETLSASKASYINADNTGVEQFPLEYLAAKPEGAYTSSLVQGKVNNKVLYLDGGVSGRYLTTTENAANAVTVYAEKVTGGFKFYILVENVKQYITIYKNDENKDSVKYDPNGNCVFNYDAAVNAWITVFDNLDYYLGTYNTFNTISASKASYINASNTGVEQFPLEYNPVASEPHTHEFADATCTAPKTCECGETEGEALGHNIENKVCTGCGAQVVTVTEAAALADGTLVFIEATVSKITYAWSDSSKNMSVDLTDGTTTLNAYKLATKVGAGDVIVVYGKVSSFNGTKQIAAGATAEIKTTHTCTTYTEGKCPVCGALDPAGATQKVTLAYTNTTTSTNMNGENQAATLGLDASLFTVTGAKGSNNNNIGLNKSGEFRMYGGFDDDKNGNELSVSVASTHVIKKIKITFSGASYAGNCKVLVGENAVVTTDGNNVTVEVDINAASFILKNVNVKVNGTLVQVRIKSIEITYEAVAV